MAEQQTTTTIGSEPAPSATPPSHQVKPHIPHCKDRLFIQNAWMTENERLCFSGMMNKVNLSYIRAWTAEANWAFRLVVDLRSRLKAGSK